MASQIIGCWFPISTRILNMLKAVALSVFSKMPSDRARLRLVGDVVAKGEFSLAQECQIKPQ